jgi:ABC-2 type transport system ATP-binding protein
MNEQIIEVDHLTKHFGSFRAVNGISFSVPRGKVIGFLGPNGAGKTTTIHMLLGITTPTGGKISFFGQEFTKHKQQILGRINFTSAFNTLQGRITVWENLIVFAYLYGVKDPKKKVVDYLNYFGIPDLLHKRYMDLSSGQQTRVNLIKSLINDPEVILMDEPTASLDPDIRDKVLSLIEKLKKERNLTILYTSHNMEEITRICDEVIFLDHGKIVAQDTPLGLTKRITSATLRLIIEDKKNILPQYLHKIHRPFSLEEKNIYTFTMEEKDIPTLIFDISKVGVWITDIEVIKPTLEDVFLQIARKGSYEHRKD